MCLKCLFLNFTYILTHTVS
ncbi:hypothetical protein CUMW_285400 [Citrus unshiu]|uniref:Uncharacterized protein n=1 Tax=Citrus unshiu TaxID=55188 RepID=A0A2H5MWZ4_CITUN|nr:hypothetical protein CUMW_285400 [Citrus unshiu]